MGTGGRPRRRLRIAIIGAGPGGLCAGICLARAGFEDYVILEKATGLGGTWYHNRYPGCACDIPSFLYSFSFEPKCDWSRPFGSQAEILAYLEHCARKYRQLSRSRFGCGVASARWDERRACWVLRLESGESLEADVVVSALGMFNELAWPEIPGRADFAGTQFHSARWDLRHDLSGETVGVIGSAASAVQFVPEIVKQARQVHLFQRTANWVMPKQDEPFSAEQLALFAAHPEAVAAGREQIYRGVDGGMTFSDPVAVAEMEASVLAAIEVVHDPVLRAKLRPQHPFGCKRPLLSNDYYPAFNRANLELVTERIERIGRNAVMTADGRSRRVDTLIFATGFATTKYLSVIDVVGRGGQPIDEAWHDGARAYLGITSAGFPNLFMLYGPNTNNGSILTMIEAQVDYVVRQIQRIADEDLAWIDVRPEAMERYNEDVQQAIGRVAAWQADCNGYYRGPRGRVVTQWPYTMTEFRERTSKPDPEAYEAVSRGAGA